MLRPLRRLRFVLFPLYAGAMVALGIRLGWAHDPRCPHHAGRAAEAAAKPSPHATHAGHGAHRSDAAHAAVATATSRSGDPKQDAPDAPCRCLDPDCSLTGVVAVLDADAGDALAVDAPALDASLRAMPGSVARPGAYRTHRLPFPFAPPGVEGLT